MKAAELLVQCLEAEGVELIFGLPGEENLDVLDALSRSKIRFIPTRHEQAAGFMAATYGRLTGRPGVCLATLGPGATNLVTAAAYASLGGFPMVMLTGQKPTRTRPHGRFQLVDVVQTLAPHVRLSRRIDAGELIPAMLRESFRTALTPRAGPVHLELPEDIAGHDLSAEMLPPIETFPVIASDEAVTAAVHCIRKARRPVLLFGSEANRREAGPLLAEFVDQTGIPFLVTQMGKGTVDERHPLFLGCASLSDGDFDHQILGQTDLIIAVGYELAEKPPFGMSRMEPFVLHVSETPSCIEAVYHPRMEVLGQIGETLQRIGARFDHPLDWDCEPLLKISHAGRRHFQTLAEVSDFPMRLPAVVAELRQLLPENAVLALDNGLYKLWFARDFPTYGPQSLLLDNALASMGAGLPAAMAARLVDRTRPVIAVCGDGGYLMNSGELETARRLNLDLTILVLNDNAYGMIGWKQSDLGMDEFGVSLTNPDFVRHAESFGATGMRIESSAQFRPIVAEAVRQPGVSVVEVPIDYSGDHILLNEVIPQVAVAESRQILQGAQ